MATLTEIDSEIGGLISVRNRGFGRGWSSTIRATVRSRSAEKVTAGGTTFILVASDDSRSKFVRL
jgi:hypothetical protein